MDLSNENVEKKWSQMHSFVNLPQENDTTWLTDELEHKKNGSVIIGNDVIATTWKDGPYLLIVKIVSSKPESTWSLNGTTHFYFFAIFVYAVVPRSQKLQNCATCLQDLKGRVWCVFEESKRFTEMSQ